MCHNELKSLALRRAAKIAAAAASVNFGWRGGAPNFFRRRQRGRVPAGCGGGIRRLRGLVCMPELIAILIPIHGLFSCLADVYGFFNPSSKLSGLSALLTTACSCHAQILPSLRDLVFLLTRYGHDGQLDDSLKLTNIDDLCPCNGR